MTPILGSVNGMIQGISHNAFLASVFGTQGARAARGAFALTGDASQKTAADQATEPYAQPVDRVELSSEARHSSLSNENAQRKEDEQREVRELKRRDQEVRRHEQAHKAAAGSHASGGPSFEYTTGPDGKRYAVGGEVNIDTSEVSGDPQATIAKMQQIRRAAHAPANPSSQDRAIAARAAGIERQAQAELVEQKRTEESEGQKSEPPTASLNPAEAVGELLDLVA